MLDYSPKFLYDEKKRPRQSFKFLHVVVVAIKKEPKCHERGNWIATFVCLCGIYVESLKEKKSSSFFSDFNTFLPFFYFWLII